MSERRKLGGRVILLLADSDSYASITLLIAPVGGTLPQCDPSGFPLTLRWTGAAIIAS
jgi:hypothetical protein